MKDNIGEDPGKELLNWKINLRFYSIAQALKAGTYKRFSYVEATAEKPKYIYTYVCTHIK